MMTDDITIRWDLRPGDLGRIAALHGEVYAAEPGFPGDLTFEAYECRTLADFILDDAAAGRIWLAEKGGELVGCAAMIDRGGRGQLRWVLVSPAARGTGLGGELVNRAMDYARNEGLAEVYLETTTGLAASMAIYEKLGFRIVSEEPLDHWNAAGHKKITMTMAFS
ncbi:GNAT family N-acetyltransferase [Hyphococcus sp.]|jgi:RimJ/RimL family protein N-acetyltransferase|uniref:GNAT family N-acetyltransferase n=1 Tax=Hyphococcus sp. TaxID=2038636 RepID=UPI003D0B29F7